MYAYPCVRAVLKLLIVVGQLTACSMHPSGSALAVRATTPPQGVTVQAAPPGSVIGRWKRIATTMISADGKRQTQALSANPVFWEFLADGTFRVGEAGRMSSGTYRVDAATLILNPDELKEIVPFRREADSLILILKAEAVDPANTQTIELSLQHVEAP